MPPKKKGKKKRPNYSGIGGRRPPAGRHPASGRELRGLINAPQPQMGYDSDGGGDDVHSVIRRAIRQGRTDRTLRQLMIPDDDDIPDEPEPDGPGRTGVQMLYDRFGLAYIPGELRDWAENHPQPNDMDIDVFNGQNYMTHRQEIKHDFGLEFEQMMGGNILEVTITLPNVMGGHVSLARQAEALAEATVHFTSLIATPTTFIPRMTVSYQLGNGEKVKMVTYEDARGEDMASGDTAGDVTSVQRGIMGHYDHHHDQWLNNFWWDYDKQEYTDQASGDILEFVDGIAVLGGNEDDRRIVAVVITMYTDPADAGMLQVGVKRKREPRPPRSRFSYATFTSNPEWWNKSVLDCGTTEGTGDCVLRCVAYAYLIEKGHHLHDPSALVPQSTKDKSAYLHNYRSRKAGDSARPSKIFLDVKKLRSILIASDSSYMHLPKQINIKQLFLLCVKEGVGFNARFRVFEAKEDGAGILYQSPDLRAQVIENPEEVAEPETHEEKMVRMDEGGDDEPEFVHSDSLMGKPPEQTPPFWINLLLHNGHCTFVQKPGIICNSAHFCDPCGKAYQNDRAHKCVDKCDRCYSRECVQQDPQIVCSYCNRVFYGPQCLALHEQKDYRGGGKWKGRSVCDNYWLCVTDRRCAGVLFNAYEFDRRLHVHGETTWCTSCRLYVPADDHVCMIKKKNPKYPPKSYDLWFFDLETYQEGGESSGGRHVCNHAQLMNSDGSVHLVFYNIETLVDYMLKDVGREQENGELDKRYISHNGGRFDIHLVLEQVFKVFRDRGMKVDKIARGTSIQLVNVYRQSEDKAAEEKDVENPHSHIGAVYNQHLHKKLKKMHEKKGRDTVLPQPVGMQVSFIDSINFIKSPLRMFSETFAIHDVRKGDFPHHFNTGEEFCSNYSGVIPQAEFFGIEQYSHERMKEFIPWYCQHVYETEKSEEAATEEVTSFLSRYSHLFPQFVAEEFRSKYRYKGDWDFQLEMFEYCKSDVNLLRLGCLAFREQMMTITKVKAKTKTMIGFRTYPKGAYLPSVDPFSFVTISSFCYDSFLRWHYEHASISHLEKHVEKWVRRGFTGGRTEAFQLYRRCMDLDDPGERIEKADFCSCYPYINKHGLYPGGQPVVIKSLLDWKQVAPDHEKYECESLDDVVRKWSLLVIFGGLDAIGNPKFYNGLFMAELSYQGPADLRVPVIGAKRKNPDTGECKFVFDLEPHYDEVVNCVELYEAVKRGYKIWNVKQIVWWPKVVVGMFGTYVDMMISAKFEAGGWPAHCADPDPEVQSEKRRRWIAEVERDNPGVKLDPTKIGETKNCGKYATAKMSVNCVWGKITQRHNMPQTKYFGPHQYSDMYKIVCDPGVDWNWREVVKAQLVEMIYTSTEDTYNLTRNTNIACGVFTTAQARCWLYRHIVTLGRDQLLYVDTDSCMYYYNQERKDHIMLDTTSDKLGALTDEFSKQKKKGLKCVEFIAGGPKNYGSVMVVESDSHNRALYKTELKIKGHNLNSGYADRQSARNILTYASVKKLILNHATKASEDHETVEHLVLGSEQLNPLMPVLLDHEQYEVDSRKEELESTVELAMVEMKCPMDEENKLESIKVSYRGRFKLNRNFQVKNIDATSTYGWTYDKGCVDVSNITTTAVPTYPFGFGREENKQAEEEESSRLNEHSSTPPSLASMSQSAESPSDPPSSPLTYKRRSESEEESS